MHIKYKKPILMLVKLRILMKNPLNFRAGEVSKMVQKWIPIFFQNQCEKIFDEWASTPL